MKIPSVSQDLFWLLRWPDTDTAVIPAGVATVDSTPCSFQAICGCLGEQCSPLEISSFIWSNFARLGRCNRGCGSGDCGNNTRAKINVIHRHDYLIMGRPMIKKHS